MIRISGTDARTMGEKLTQTRLLPESARKAKRVNVFAGSGKRRDDAVILPFFAPHSFTGEDSIELFLHGSPMVAQKVLDEIFELG